MSPRFKAHCALMACSFFWGVTFVVVKDALADISVFAYLAARFLLGAIPVVWLYRADLKRLTHGEAWAGVQVGLLMFGGYAFQTAGIALTTPSKAAFITGVSVVLVPIFLALFWRKPIGAWAWVGVAGSFVGLYYLTVPKEGIANLNRGDLLVMGCAVLYALQIIYIAQYASRYSLGSLSCLQIAMTGALSAIAIPIFDATGLQRFFVRYTFAMYFGVLVTAVFTTAIAYPLLVWAQRHTTPTNTALILATEPVCAAITSYFVVHERLGARALAGAALILIGMIIGELKSGVPEAETA